MSNEIRILGCPVLPLDKGLEEDGVTFGIRRVWPFQVRETYSRRPFSFVLADELLRDTFLWTDLAGVILEFRLSTSTIEQIRKDLESGVYRL